MTRRIRRTVGTLGLLAAWLLPGAPAAAQPAGASAGTYTVVDGSYAIELVPNGAVLTVVEPNKRSDYRRQPDGTYQFYNPGTDATYGIRIVDDHTVEAFKPGRADNVPTRLSRVGGPPPPPPPAAPSLPAAEAQAAAATPPPVPDAAPAAGDRYGDLARMYEQRTSDDPANVHAWAACAAAAMKRSTANAAEADAYAVQMIQMLKVIMADPERSPCDDAIPASLWAKVPAPGAAPSAAAGPAAARPLPDPAVSRAAAAAAEQDRLRRLNAEADARAASDAERRAAERRAYDAKVAEAQAAQDRFTRDQAAYEAEATRARAAADEYQRQLDAYRKAGGKAVPR